MEYVRLGSAGLKVSRICLGCMSYGSKQWRSWALEEEESRPFIRRGLELGINFFDTADMYSEGASEEILGRALRDFAEGRDRVVIATKVFNPMNADPNGRGLSRKHIRHAVEESLRRLGTDYIDLYQIHRLDPETPAEEMLEALDDLVRSGKVLYLGASSMYAWQFARLQHLAERHGLTRFVSMQNHYNLLYREEEREMNPFCRATGVAVLPWSPLARGFLSGNRRAGEEGETERSRTDPIARKFYYQACDYAVVDAVTSVASRVGASNARIALAWLLAQPAVTAPVVGATKMSHLDDAVAAVDLHLERDMLNELEAPYQPHSILGHS